MDCPHWGGLPGRKAWPQLLRKMDDWASMRWGEIDNNKKHYHMTGLDGLCSEAVDRLRYLEFADGDRLACLRFSSTQRLWGVRDADRFRILWWDPEHRVYPSRKKHT